MLTGVTKFGKVSVFSDLNNLNDISMWNQYIDICGVSDQELHDNLEVELSEFADARGMTYNEICDIYISSVLLEFKALAIIYC